MGPFLFGSASVAGFTPRERAACSGDKDSDEVSSTGPPPGPGSRHTDTHTDRPPSVQAPEPEAPGLAPELAESWLRLQAELAWHPEKAGPLLRTGRSPESILAELRSLCASAAELDRGRDVASAERLARLDARIVPLPDPGYPDALRAIDDAPLVLSVRGRVDRLRDPAVAIVGARAATRAARAFARRLAFDLARAGLTIVSGLARGIDAEAHRGALEAGGTTIGVLACGIDRIYPPEHRGLAQEMIARGAIVSELPLGALPRPIHFPLRNRIISGLSRAVVVVEARARSGSLITVRHALAQGREVFVVPGAVDGPFAVGTNQLLREGARAIQSARDLLEDLGFSVEPEALGHRRSLRATGSLGSPDRNGPKIPLTERLLAVLTDGPRTPDALLIEAGLDPGRLATALLELELAGRVVEDRDGCLHVSRTPEHREPGAPPLPCPTREATMLPPAAGAGPATEAGSLMHDESSDGSICEVGVRLRDRPNP